MASSSIAGSDDDSATESNGTATTKSGSDADRDDVSPPDLDSSPFAEGEKVLAFHSCHIYEAKVLQSPPLTPPLPFPVCFKCGWANLALMQTLVVEILKLGDFSSKIFLVDLGKKGLVLSLLKLVPKVNRLSSVRLTGN